MKADDRQAFADLASSRLPALRRFAFALCHDWHQADDLVQDSLIKLYACWPLRDEGAADAWLRTTVTRQWIDQTRKAWWRRERATEYLPERPVGGPDTAEADAVSRLLQRVPPRQRACLVLRFLEDYSIEQTAAALKVSTGTVKSLTSRGLETLRKGLQPQTSSPGAEGETQ